jgi:2-C-methyl-D-erythritol 2,4-cyclodiphosphate synthase
MDALLGAAALGDIGKHFPDSDDRFKGISSLELLRQVAVLIDGKNYVVENIDATIIAQKPKMRPYIDAMCQNIADTLGIEIDRVNVKATTEEGLGFTGSGEGISSQAICSLSDVTNYIYGESDMTNCCGKCGKCQ